MKKLLVLLLVVLLVLNVVGCKSQEQKMVEEVMEEYLDDMESYEDEDDLNLEPNDDGFGDDEGESAGVDDGDGNGEAVVDDDESSIQVGGGSWPENAPKSIVEPGDYINGVPITGVVTAGNGAVVTYANVDRQLGADYITIYLDSSAWTMLSHTTDSDWESYSGTCGDLVLSIEWAAGDFSLLWETMG